MNEFKIEPHRGIGPILLGATRAAIRAALASEGFPLASDRKTTDYFCDAAIQVEYGDDDCADFIGCACHHAYSLTYRDVKVFDAPAEAVFALIAHHDDSGPHAFDDSGYEFPNQIVTLWDADSQYDRMGGEKRPVWGQVGLGNRRYQDAVREIENRGA